MASRYQADPLSGASERKRSEVSRILAEPRLGKAGPEGSRPESHFVATGYVVRDGKTLLLLHKKLKMWLPPGGHIDEGELPEEALLREIREETGLEVEIVSEKRAPDPADGKVRYLYVPNHVQLEDIPDHPRHIDLIYFCRARNGQPVIREAEHDGMRWHGVEDLLGAHVSEEVRVTATLAIRHVEALSPKAG